MRALTCQTCAVVCKLDIAKRAWASCTVHCQHDIDASNKCSSSSQVCLHAQFDVFCVVQGWIDVTYLSQDGKLRLTRGNKGDQLSWSPMYLSL